MPIYDYLCGACGHRVEVIHGVHDAGPVICPNCGGPLRKALSMPSIVFRGSGWAKKDRTSSTSGKMKSDAARSDAAEGGKPAAAEGGGKSDSAKGSKSDAGEGGKAKAGGQNEGSAAGRGE